MEVFVSSIQPAFVGLILQGFILSYVFMVFLRETAHLLHHCLAQNEIKGSRKDPTTKVRYCQRRI